MQKNIITLVIVLGSALILAGLSALAFPEWLEDWPGGSLLPHLPE